MILDINQFYEEEHTASKSILHGGKEYIAYDEVIRLLKKCNDQQLCLYGVTNTLQILKELNFVYPDTKLKKGGEYGDDPYIELIDFVGYEENKKVEPEHLRIYL